MKKRIFTALLLSAMLLTGCSDGSSDSSGAEKPQAAWQSKTAFSSAGTAIAGVMADMEKEMFASFDKAVYGGFIKAFGSEQLKGCTIRDLDGDGRPELAVRAYFNGGLSDSYMLAKNEPALGIYYSPGVYDGDVSRGFRLESSGDQLLFNVRSTAQNEKYDKYFRLTEDGWTLSSIMTGNASDDSGKKSSIVKDEYASKEDFVRYANSLAELNEKEDVFNVCIEKELTETAAVFMRYLRRNYEPSMITYKNEEDGSTVCLITVPNLIDTYRVTPFFNGEKTKDPRDGFIKTILSAKTACFVLDTTDKGTRIRCQLYGKSVTFKNIKGKLSMVTSDGTQEMRISSANSNIDNSIIS